MLKKYAKYDNCPFDFVFDEIGAALRAKLFYSAISLSVAIPDYCCTLEGNLPTTWQTYKDWFSKYASKYFSSFGPHEAYALRCGVVHNARFIGGKIKHTKVTRIVFNLPLSTGTVISENSNYDSDGFLTLDLDVQSFCRAMISAARDWEKENSNNQTVEANLHLLVRYRDSDNRHSSGFAVIS